MSIKHISLLEAEIYGWITIIVVYKLTRRRDRWIAKWNDSYRKPGGFSDVVFRGTKATNKLTYIVLIFLVILLILGPLHKLGVI